MTRKKPAQDPLMKALIDPRMQRAESEIEFYKTKAYVRTGSRQILPQHRKRVNELNEVEREILDGYGVVL